MLRTLILLAFPLLFIACGETIKGDGNLTQKEHTVDDFQSIESTGMFEIVLVQGAPKVLVECDDNLHEHIQVEVNGGKLRVSSGDKFLDAKQLLVTIYYEELHAIELSGATDLVASGVITSETLNMEINGAAEADLAVDVERFEIDLSGGAELELSGTATIAEFDLSGAAEIDALELNTTEAYIEISGAGEIEISCSDKLVVDISGAGEVKYKGDPEVEEHISGAGELKKL